MLHRKYNRNIDYFLVPEKLKTMYIQVFTYKILGKISYNNHTFIHFWYIYAVK